MSPVIFRFGLYLRLPFEGATSREVGAVGFHRWYPQGPDDALVLDTGHPNAVLRVWFLPKHASDGTLGAEKGALEKADEEELGRYGVIWSGPLFGDLTVSRGLSTADIAALEKTGDEVMTQHEAIAKTVVENWLCPP